MNALHTIHLLGAAQGLFLAFVLASRHRNSLPNKLLGAIMALFSLELVTPVYPALTAATYPLPVLYSPMFYLYVKTLSEGQRRLRRPDLLHFLPFLALLVWLIPLYLVSGNRWASQLQVIDQLKFLYALGYVIAIVGVLRRHAARVKARFSSLDGIQLAWLRVVTIGGIALWVVALVFYVAGVRTPSGDHVVVAVAGFVYVVGYLGFRQREIFDPSSDHEEARPSPYARSGLDPDTAKTIAARVEAAMESGKHYRRSDLTLRDLAAALSISPHNLSEVISTQLGTTFYDLVNRYRVREVQQRLADPGTAHLTVLSIGLDAGFNSKSSFNAAFKQVSGMTPSEYRRSAAGDTVETS